MTLSKKNIYAYIYVYMHIHIHTCVYMHTQNKLLDLLEIQCVTSDICFPCKLCPYVLDGVPQTILQKKTPTTNPQEICFF